MANRRSLMAALVSTLLAFGCVGDANSGGAANPSVDAGMQADVGTSSSGDAGTQTTSTSPDSVQWDVCTGSFAEPIASADLSDLRASYSSDQWWETALAVLDRTYAHGRVMLEGEGRAEQLERWWEESSRATFDGLLDNLNLAVHEGCHDRHWTLSSGSNYQIDAHLTGSPIYQFPMQSRSGGWPTRGSITPLMPSFMQSNGFYTLYFTNQEMEGMAEDDINGLLDEYACYVQGDAAGLGVNLMDNMGEDLASFMLFGVLYLRQMQTSDALAFQQVLDTPDLARAFLALHDRASFLLQAGRDRGLINTSSVDPMLAEVARSENQAVLTTLRGSLCP